MNNLVSGLPEALGAKLNARGEAVSINRIVFDSREAAPGSLFVALVGGKRDGHHFIHEAVQAGAAAVVGQNEAPPIDVPYLQVNDSRLALAHLAAAFYGYPGRGLTVIGVTGTDGKTTTSNYIFSILKAAGIQAGMISTVNAVIGEQVVDTGFHVTTPEAPDVQRYLSQMFSAGLSHAVLETTSHGLAQHRTAACEFDIGVVTNITHEHLDYHGSYEAYRAAKARLFDMIGGRERKGGGDLRIAILNRDDQSYDFLTSYIQKPEVARAGVISQITYGRDDQADVFPRDVSSDSRGVRFTAIGPGFRFPVETQMAGEYNLMNCLAAIAATVGGLNIPPEFAAEGIYRMLAIPGRMEVLDLGTDFLTIVDFAHTPYALHQALLAARRIVRSEISAARVIAVFGSAGLRDREKRRMMAMEAAELADFTILTAEDPRTEPLDGILDEMAAGCRNKGGIEGKTFWRIPDRGDALRFALSLARSGDAVIALGKGHEQSMCFGNVEYPWDDRTAMRAAAAELLGVPGPEMPELPTKNDRTAGS